MRTIRAAYRAAWSEYRTKWALLDRVLYNFCRSHPRHTREAVLNTKLLLIGRTYATGIERRIPSRGRQADALFRLGDYLYRRPNRERLDDICARLEAIARPPGPAQLDLQVLPIIVREHGRLVRLLAGMARQGHSPRSFASKYLHFHCPAVPIMDALAAQALRRLCACRTVDEQIPRPRGADAAYHRFALRFWQIYRELLGRRIHVSVRGVDRYLIWNQQQRHRGHV